MIDDNALDEVQAAVTALFARRLSAVETAHTLATDPAFANHRDWVRSFQPALVDAASMLVAHWARTRA